MFCQKVNKFITIALASVCAVNPPTWRNKVSARCFSNCNWNVLFNVNERKQPKWIDIPDSRWPHILSVLWLVNPRTQILCLIF